MTRVTDAKTLAVIHRAPRRGENMAAQRDRSPTTSFRDGALEHFHEIIIKAGNRGLSHFAADLHALEKVCSPLLSRSFRPNVQSLMLQIFQIRIH